MSDITDVLVGAKARKKILGGVNKVFDAVKLSLGPEGRNALLPRTYNRGPRITNDGITMMELARQLSDEHERLAAEAYTEGSKKTNELAGDGTTGTAIIAGTLINKIFSEISDTPTANVAGITTKKKGVRALRKEMRDAKDLVLAEIKAQAKPIKTLADLEKIAVVSIGKEDEDSAKVVAKMVWEIGRDGNGDFVDNYIDVVEGYKGELETEVIRGMRYPAKVAHRAFLNNPARFEMVADDVAVFITNYKLDNPFELMGVLERTRPAKIAIFAPEFGPGVIKSIIETTKAGLFCYPVKCPALRTEQLEDLAVYTGATLIDKSTDRKLANVTVSDLGFAEKIVVKDTENKEDALLLGGRGERTKRGDGTLITERQEILKKQIKEARNELSKGSLERRIANLSSAVGVIRVGATTNADGLYLKLKIEDGVNACKSALQEGYVVGGGLCLKKIADKLEENVLTEALRAPYEQLQRNAGNIEIGKEIIDPAKVIRMEVEHGVSVAGALITCDVSIPEVREKSPQEGYAEIARAINNYVHLQAKQLGMLKESQEYENEEHERAFRDVLDSDKG